VGILAGFRSLLAVPVATDQEVLGVIAVLHRDPGEFDASAERLLDILASQASVAIKNAQLYRATQQLAVTDGLTKVYNRRYFEEQLLAELTRARRQKHTTSLIVLDVDHFKRFNDTHGHLLGDHVLQGVARILQKSVRETDLVARYGGEEFVVILPETPGDAAVEVAQRIRRNIKSHPFWGKGQTPLQVTASLGLASDVLSLLEPRTLFEQADKCLYQAKAEGRDRVSRVVYVPDQPIAITTSQQESPKEPTLRRHMRAVTQLSAEEWSRYLHGHLPEALDTWWGDPRVQDALQDGRDFWAHIARQFAEVLLRKLNSSEEERNGWLENFQGFTVYPHIQSELSRLIQHGVTITQLEHAILGFYKKTQALIQGAPFSLEERMTVGVIQERLFHVLQLMVAQVWHDFYQATSEHLTLIAELEQRLGEFTQQDEILAEIAHLTSRALRADGCLLLLPDDASTRLVAAAGWGVSNWRKLPELPMTDSLSGHCFLHQEAAVIGDVQTDPRVNAAFHSLLEEARSVRSILMLPLLHQNSSLGVLYCMSEMTDQFMPLDARLGHGIAARLATTLARHRIEADRQARYLASVEALVSALENQHSNAPSRVAELAKSLAEASGLSARQIAQVEQAVRLHDIGEIAVPRNILEKPSPLTVAEKEVVHAHPIVGANILGYVDALQEIIPIIRHHHERVDGSGYPDGLRGENIPILARILAVADAFDAMTSERPYREALPPHAAIQELRASKQFDDVLLTQLETVVAKIEIPE
jgi:diguanylate cyclase (GGDEF)-like protein